jgi:hypothetical protein
MPWHVINERSKDMAVHAVLLPTGQHGKILYFGGYSVDDTHLYDVDSQTIVDIAAAHSPDYNAFCSGHAFLADGRILVAGGQLPSPDPNQDEHQHGNMAGGGERRCAVFKPLSAGSLQGIPGAWEEITPMNLDPSGDANSGGRWYPTLVTLSNGDVLAIGGHPDVREVYPGEATQRHANNIPERYNAGSNSWTLLGSDPPVEKQTTNEADHDFHRAHLLSSGKVFVVSPVRGKNRIYDPYAGQFLDSPVIDLPGEGMYQGVSAAWTSVMLPLLHQEGFRVRVLLMGGLTPQRIDLGADPPQWHKAGDRDWNLPEVPGLGKVGPVRNFVSPVILPTGQIFFAGGTTGGATAEESQANCVKEGEIYTPGINWQTGQYNSANESWETVEAATAGRYYHGVAILMPNGAVWTAGSNGPTDDPQFDPNQNPEKRELRIEIYEPDYFNQPRPVITECPTNIGYIYPFLLKTPQANNIARVALIRCGSVTHGFNMDQCYISVDFEVVNNNTLRVFTQADADTLPPGRYMVWIIDNNGRPCQWARFIRISHQKALISADISTFSLQEVQALGTPAEFPEALYLVYDGFLPDEVTTPTFSIKRADDTDVPGMSATLGVPLYEGGFDNKDTAQRIVFPCKITFTSQQAFNQIPANEDFEDVTFIAQMHDFPSQITLTLSKNPNPRMSDGDPPWLSIDLRAFSTKPDESFTAGVEHGSGLNAPYDYIKDVLQKYDTWPENQPHPFDDLPTDQDKNKIPLYSQDENGHNVFNYAVARVRFRAPAGVDALDVRVFFRLWTTGWTSLEYDTNGSYRRFGSGPGATPLLGLTGGEVNNVPCFAEPRNANMEQQTDTTNRKTIQGAGAKEVWTYFGCWLDCNQNVKRFPSKPQGNGPYTEDLMTIQELMRGLHQCLVAEIYYEPDPTPANATPGSSDNLAQRNLLLDETPNPGGFASHLVHHTFEIKPSPFSLPMLPQAQVAGAAVTGRLHPDELCIHWGNLPRDSHVTFYLPQVDVDQVIRYASLRNGPAHLSRAGQNTISCKVSDVSFIPIPGPFQTTLPGLMSIQLPPNVTKGQKFKVVVRQVNGRNYRAIGTFQFEINVKTTTEILPHFKRNLSVLKHIGQSIPQDNRWYPVFQRYLQELGDRVRAFGVDPDDIGPSPTGSGHPDHKPPVHVHKRLCLEGWIVSLILALVLVLIGFSSSMSMLAVVLAVGIVLLAVLIGYWVWKCRGRNLCSLFDHLTLGSSAALVPLVIVALSNAGVQFTAPAILTAALLSTLFVFLSFVLGCRDRCCDEPR